MSAMVDNRAGLLQNTVQLPAFSRDRADGHPEGRGQDPHLRAHNRQDSHLRALEMVVELMQVDNKSASEDSAGPARQQDLR